MCEIRRNRLVQGKVALTEDAALRLEPVLGTSAGFWLTREARYRERAARLKAARRRTEWVRWLDELPVRELMNAGAVPKRRIDAKSRPGPPPCRYPAPRLARGCEWLCESKSL